MALQTQGSVRIVIRRDTELVVSTYPPMPSLVLPPQHTHTHNESHGYHIGTPTNPTWSWMGFRYRTHEVLQSKNFIYTILNRSYLIPPMIESS